MVFQGLFNKDQFQNNAFQTGVGATIQLLGGGADVSKEWLKKHGFQYPYQELRNKKYKEDLLKLEQTISDAKTQKLDLHKKLEEESRKKSQEKYKKQLNTLAVLEANAQEEIRLMLVERRRLIRQLDDEECFIVLSCLPFIN